MSLALAKGGDGYYRTVALKSKQPTILQLKIIRAISPYFTTQTVDYLTQCY